LVRTEGDLKVKEEMRRRVEASEQFQATMEELSSLMGTHTESNRKYERESRWTDLRRKIPQ